ncbi:MAG: succinate dehydrogenase flavoprotein subunit [Candidatus Omnitrophica bacterium]|nr:succinate dehydrogenase flavoprotein subunit [Candidatus Omnitrophota bacterium]
MASSQVIVVGGGLAGLMAVIRASELGLKTLLFSVVPVRRSHSVCAQGGINAAVNTMGEGDNPAIHFDETVYGGDFLANQTMVKEMCEAAPGIIFMMDRMGVAFNRKPDGTLDFRRFGGTKFHRTAFAGATTGQQLMYALDEQARRYESEGLVTKHEGWEFIGILKDSAGNCRGILAIHLHSLEIHAFRADAVLLATGGPGLIYGRTTNSMINTGSAASAVYQQGCWYANPEFIQVHPTAVPGEDKLRLISESVRGEGGRVWTYKDGKPWYFLEEKYPKYGNLVPRDIASREIFDVVYEQKLGVDGKEMVYLDVTHIDPKVLNAKLAGVLEIYEKFVGADPRKVPMRVFPAVHYSMGGIYIDQYQATNIAGLFAAGECEYQYHGANRLGANSLLSCIFGGARASDTVKRYLSGLNGKLPDIPSHAIEHAVRAEEGRNKELFNSTGSENVIRLWGELGEVMRKNVTIVRHNDRLRQTEMKVKELMERFSRINLADQTPWTNQPLVFARQLWNMFILAQPIIRGALLRDESRGAHYKPDFPKRDDAKFLKTTVAKYTPGGPEVSYEEVDASHIKPRLRKYD